MVTDGIQFARPAACFCSLSIHGPTPTVRRAASSAPERQQGGSGGHTKMADTRKLTKQERAALKALAAMPDSEIDTADMPEVTDWRSEEHTSELQSLTN